MSTDLGAGVSAALAELAGRAAALTQLTALKQQLQPGRERELEVIALQVQDLEAKVAHQRAEIAQQAEQLKGLRALKDDAVQTGVRLRAVQAALPTHLPGMQQQQACETPQQPSRPPLGELHSEPAALPNASAGGATHRPSKPSRQPPVLAYVTEAELATAPPYMRSRLGVEKLNAAVQEAQKMLNEKYALLSTPSSQLRSLSEANRKRHAVHKEAETDETKKLFFLSETDLKSSNLLRQGEATGKNILAVLRHVGRLREFKHQGQRCWHTR
jgi:hypothetical protein